MLPSPLPLPRSHITREAGTWEPLPSTTEILTATHVIEEQGVRLRLSLTDTPGFGDQVDNSGCFQPILQHITTQYSTYLQSEIGPNRPPKIPDTRIHALLYFISPTGHGLKPLDISFMKAVHNLVRLCVAQPCRHPYAPIPPVSFTRSYHRRTQPPTIGTAASKLDGVICVALIVGVC